MEREQFRLSDVRALDEVMRELISDGHLPSFCTSCYRLGRTGEHFMEFAVPGFIKRFCTPNALLTLMEYLIDYASPETAAAGRALIDRELAQIEDETLRRHVAERLGVIENESRRDLYF
jgi:2-iminoacetate synthase